MFDRDKYINSPYEIEKELLKYFKRNDKLCIFDIGCCEGEDSIKLARLFPEAKVFSFEPLPVNLERAKENFATYDSKNILLNPIALSNKKGKAKFYVSSGHPEGSQNNENWDFGNKSSSILEPEKVLDEISWLKFENTIEVECETLLHFCKNNNIECIDFVHMDVQGAEIMVLEGAGDFLKRIKSIYLEVEAVSLYKGQSLKNQVEEFMASNGFIIIQDNVDHISGDQFYVRKDLVATDSLSTKLFSVLKRKIFSFVPNKDVLKISHSQSGEDMIVDFIFNIIGVQKPSYIDIGAHHPYKISNTAYLYSKGSRGINIEPDPSLYKEFLKHRNNDVNLNIGVGDSSAVLDFYVMEIPTLNTFSKEEAERISKEYGHKISTKLQIEVQTLENVLNKYNNGRFPDFLSLDVEGLDEAILRSINFQKSRPTVICLETISYSENGTGVKNHELIKYLETKGYMLYADTYINSILVLRDKWVRDDSN